MTPDLNIKKNIIYRILLDKGHLLCVGGESWNNQNNIVTITLLCNY